MSFHSASYPISIPLRSTHDMQTNASSQSFLDLCKEITPPCHLNPFLFNGHAQTFWTAVKSRDIPVTYKRKIFNSDSLIYPGTFAVDFVVPTLHPRPAVDATLPPRTTYWDDAGFDGLGTDDEKPMLIMLHGLAGGSNEIYLRSVLKLLCLDPPELERWEAVVVNARGCAMSEITASGVLYNARATWDIRQFAKWARGKWAKRKLFACGFSLGANILVNVCSNYSQHSLCSNERKEIISLTVFC
jgi:predicted alpha/beta-fold hydrolase